MTLSKKPILDEEGLRNSERPSELDIFLDALFLRTNALLQEVDDGKLNGEIVCFETLISAFSALDEGRSHEEIKTAYPKDNWQEETIEIPKALIQLLLEGWVRYKAAGPQQTLGECFGLEGGGQGREPLKAVLARINQSKRYSNGVMIEYLAAQTDGKRISYETAIGIVADREGVSHQTVKRASEKMRPDTIAIMQARGWLKS